MAGYNKDSEAVNVPGTEYQRSSDDLPSNTGYNMRKRVSTSDLHSSNKRRIPKREIPDEVKDPLKYYLSAGKSGSSKLVDKRSKQRNNKYRNLAPSYSIADTFKRLREDSRAEMKMWEKLKEQFKGYYNLPPEGKGELIAKLREAAENEEKSVPMSHILSQLYTSHEMSNLEYFRRALYSGLFEGTYQW